MEVCFKLVIHHSESSVLDELEGQRFETILVIFFLSQDKNVYGSQHI